MAGRNKAPLVGWHPKSADDLAWLEAEVERRGGGRGVRSDLLDEMLAAFVASQGSNQPQPARVAPPKRPRKPRTSAPAATFKAEPSGSDIVKRLFDSRRNGEQDV